MSKKHKTKAETDDDHQLRATSSLIESKREREREREREKLVWKHIIVMHSEMGQSLVSLHSKSHVESTT
jgi:hypothetical protein